MRHTGFWALSIILIVRKMVYRKYGYFTCCRTWKNLTNIARHVCSVSIGFTVYKFNKIIQRSCRIVEIGKCLRKLRRTPKLSRFVRQLYVSVVLVESNQVR